MLRRVARIRSSFVMREAARRYGDAESPPRICVRCSNPQDQSAPFLV